MTIKLRVLGREIVIQIKNPNEKEIDWEKANKKAKDLVDKFYNTIREKSKKYFDLSIEKEVEREENS